MKTTTRNSTAPAIPARQISEPMSLRISDQRDPHRARKFVEVLDRRAANMSEVIRALIDAYVASDGRVDFPAALIARHGSDGASARGHGRDGH